MMASSLVVRPLKSSEEYDLQFQLADQSFGEQQAVRRPACRNGRDIGGWRVRAVVGAEDGVGPTGLIEPILDVRRRHGPPARSRDSHTTCPRWPSHSPPRGRPASCPPDTTRCPERRTSSQPQHPDSRPRRCTARQSLLQPAMECQPRAPTDRPDGAARRRGVCDRALLWCRSSCCVHRAARSPTATSTYPSPCPRTA